MTSKAATESHFRVGATLDGVDYGLWDHKDGADGTAAITKYRPGGAPHQISALPGPIDYSDLTLHRSYVSDRDGPMIVALRNKQGRAAVSVTVQDLDADLNAIAGTTTIKGTLMTLTTPPYDSMSATVAVVTLLISVEDVV